MFNTHSTLHYLFNLYPLKRKLLNSGIAVSIAIAATSALAMDEEQAPKIYVDPVTGEVVEYRKLLSEMTPEEQSRLSLDEVKKLQEIEAAQPNADSPMEEQDREPDQ